MKNTIMVLFFLLGFLGIITAWSQCSGSIYTNDIDSVREDFAQNCSPGSEVTVYDSSTGTTYLLRSVEK